MSRIVWQASYPKSGNTWFRAFFSNLTSESDEPLHINGLRTANIASARIPFDEIAGVSSSDLLPEEIERLRPYVYERIAADTEGLTYRKIHDAYTTSPHGRPLVPVEATHGVLYFVRNPLDVAVSYAHHCAKPVDDIIRQMGDEGHMMCKATNGLESQFRQRLLTWSRHVESWVDAPGLRLHLVRFEDMLAEPERTFTAAARFAELPTEPERILRAIEFSRFDVLRAQEAEDGFGERMPRAGSFFRKGEAGSWKETLTEEQVARIVADHGDVMRRFGYLNENDVPVADRPLETRA